MALIRPVAEADWPQVHDLVVEVASAGETYALEVPQDLAATRKVWVDDHVVVCVEGDRVLGTAKAGAVRPAQGAHGGTASFMVGSAARGRGVGRSLGEHVVAWHRDQGFRAIQFNAVVATNDAAVRLWRSLGFAVVGIVPAAFREPSGGYADLYVMHLDLTRAPQQLVPVGEDQRLRVLQAAARRFAELGWAATTWDDIAAEARVPVHVAHQVGSKAELLWLGATLEVMPPHRELSEAVEALALHELASVDDRLDRLVELLCGLQQRLSPFIAPLNEAAALDPEARSLQAGSDLRRLSTSRRIVSLLQRGASPAAEATELVHVLMMTETYLGFVRLGWPIERYGAWLRATLDDVVNRHDAASLG